MDLEKSDISEFANSKDFDVLHGSSFKKIKNHLLHTLRKLHTLNNKNTQTIVGNHACYAGD